MDLTPNKIDGQDLPVTAKRISSSEWNQLVASCMAFIYAAGLTPDGSDPEQFLNAFKMIAASLEIVGANTNLANLTELGEGHFAHPDLSNITASAKQTAASWIFPNYTNGVAISIPFSGNGVWTAPSNGWVNVTVGGSYMNGYRLFANGALVWQSGDDINANTKWAGVVIPVAAGTQLYYDNLGTYAFETITTVFYAA